MSTFLSDFEQNSAAKFQKYVIICTYSQAVENFGIDTHTIRYATILLSLTNKGGYMDDSLSWRAKLAKSNINILDIHDNTVFLEFTYHPKPGTFKWCKTFFTIPGNCWDSFHGGVDEEGSFKSYIEAEVLSLRKELEG